MNGVIAFISLNTKVKKRAKNTCSISFKKFLERRRMERRNLYMSIFPTHIVIIACSLTKGHTRMMRAMTWLDLRRRALATKHPSELIWLRICKLLLRFL